MAALRLTFQFVKISLSRHFFLSSNLRFQLLIVLGEQLELEPERVDPGVVVVDLRAEVVATPLKLIALGLGELELGLDTGGGRGTGVGSSRREGTISHPEKC